MRRMRKRNWLALILVPVAATAIALSLTGAAGAAGPGPVQYTHKSATTAEAGYFASAFGVKFTHIEGYIGSDGNSMAQLDPSPVNGAGYGLCDQTSGVAAQAGAIANPGGLTKNVDYAVGTFGAAVNNGNRCENGAINPGGAVPIFTGVPIGDTVEVAILFDAHHHHNGCLPGQVIFMATDITADNGVTLHSPCISLPAGTEFNEADSGVVADDTLVAPLPLQAGIQADTEPNMVARFAHEYVAGNGPSGEVKGSVLMPSSAWSIFPVASSSNGLAPLGGTVLLAPGAIHSDHFLAKIGGSPA